MESFSLVYKNLDQNRVIVILVLTVLIVLLWKYNTEKRSLYRTDYNVVKQSTYIKTQETERGEMSLLMERSHNCTLLIYNRVPKCASSTMLHFIRILSNKNRFKNAHSSNFSHYHMTLKQQKELVNKINRMERPALYERHLYFMDFERFNSSTPLYINLIRDPLERAVSAYYFFYYNGIVDTPQVQAKTIAECMEQNTSVFSNQSSDLFWTIVPFFCGQDKICRSPSRRAVNIAMRNVEKHYSIVGYTQQFPAFLQMLQFMFPQFFNGINELYNAEKTVRINSGRRNKPIPTEAKQLWTQFLVYENEFYKFIKYRFDKVYKLYL